MRAREGTGNFFLSETFGVIFFVLAVLLCRAVLSLAYIRVQTWSISKEENKYPTCGMYVRTNDIRGAKRMWRPSNFLLKHGGGTPGIIKSLVCNYNHEQNIYIIYIYIYSQSWTSVRFA